MKYKLKDDSLYYLCRSDEAILRSRSLINALCQFNDEPNSDGIAGLLKLAHKELKQCRKSLYSFFKVANKTGQVFSREAFDETDLILANTISYAEIVRTLDWKSIDVYGAENVFFMLLDSFYNSHSKLCDSARRKEKLAT